MHDERLLLEGRLNRFVRDHLEPAIYQASAPLALTAWRVPGEPVPFADAARQNFTPIDIGAAWGEPWSTLWIHAVGKVPADWLDVAASKPEVVVDLGFTAGAGFQAEALAYRPDGSDDQGRLAASTTTSRSRRREPVDFYLEAAANPDVGNTGFRPTPNGDPATAVETPLYVIKQARPGCCTNVQVWELRADIWTLSGLMHELPMDSSGGPRSCARCNEQSTSLTRTTSPGPRRPPGPELAEVLSRPASASAHRLVAVGHAHIDSRLAVAGPGDDPQVRPDLLQRGRRSMDADPTFVFACSSAQQYAWMKEYYPELFERITREGAAPASSCRSAACGSSPTPTCPAARRWPASSSPASASSSRSSASRPRRCGCRTPSATPPRCRRSSRRAGIRWFLTQKISWNQINTMPHHTFWWEGIDGTRVFTHFPPVGHLQLRPRPAASWPAPNGNYREQGRGTISLVPFGYGDGGGGPDPGDAGRRAPLGRPGGLADGADRLAGRLLQPRPRPSTRTRRSGAARCTWSCTAAPTPARPGPSRATGAASTCSARPSCGAPRPPCGPAHAYPAAELKRLWRAGAAAAVPRHPAGQLHRLGAPRRRAQLRRRRRAGRDGSSPRPSGALVGEGDRSSGAQRRPARPGRRAGARARRSPVAEAVTVEADRGDGGFMLDNGIDPGRDRRRRAAHVAASTRAPAARPSPRATAATCCSCTGTSRTNGTPGTSTSTTAAPSRELDGVDGDPAGEQAGGGRGRGRRAPSERPGSSSGSRWRPAAPSLEITNTVDWHERQKLLKLGFPLDVHADRSAAETQFGHVFRPTHTNTSWEVARFEICAHRWIHVGEPGYGVAVTNDSTYGHDVSRRTRHGRRHHHHRAAVAAAGAAVSRPGRRPGPARAADDRSGPAPASPTPSRRATGPTCRCDTCAGDHAVGAAGHASQPGRRGRGGQARRGRQRRRGRPALRVAGRPGAGHGHRRRGGWVGGSDGSAGAASARGCRQRRSIYRPRTEAVPAGHVALPRLRVSSSS